MGREDGSNELSIILQGMEELGDIEEEFNGLNGVYSFRLKLTQRLRHLGPLHGSVIRIEKRRIAHQAPG